MEAHGAEMIALFSSRSAQRAELLANVKMRPPDIVFDSEAKLDLGGVTARLLWLGEAHTKGDELIFVEPDSTLISGDVVQNKRVPSIYGDGGTPSSWIGVLDKLAPLNPRHILPDHSDPGDGSLIAQDRAFIVDLQTQGLLQILAEPNLVTTSGKEASFLVGGEFPIPVLQGGTSNAVTIQFREFGIRLNFLPQVTANHTIKLHVKPEISTIDLANGVVFSGFTIPALATRRMETDIELGEGQTFLIGGLLDDRVAESLSKVPGLSHIPILGALFKSRSENKSKTELLVMVTPETTYPFSPTDVKPMPHMLKEFLPDAPSEGHSDKNKQPHAGVVRPVGKPIAEAAADRAPGSGWSAKEIASTSAQAGAH